MARGHLSQSGLTDRVTGMYQARIYRHTWPDNVGLIVAVLSAAEVLHLSQVSGSEAAWTALELIPRELELLVTRSSQALTLWNAGSASAWLPVAAITLRTDGQNRRQHESVT